MYIYVYVYIYMRIDRLMCMVWLVPIHYLLIWCGGVAGQAGGRGVVGFACGVLGGSEVRRPEVGPATLRSCGEQLRRAAGALSAAGGRSTAGGGRSSSASSSSKHS